MSRPYSFANLGGIECGLLRLRGVGLANCLFPWARCLLVSGRFGLRRVASTWPQFCHRQWIRRDRDKRCYIGLMNERSAAIHGVRKLILLIAQPHITEHEFLARPESFHRGMVVFDGIDRYFEPMLHEHGLIRTSLLKLTREKHRPNASVTSCSICIHVRYGDFLEPGNACVPQPMNWFLHALQQCRKQLGRETPALVFSDATDEQLRPLLALPHVRRVFFGSSIADLLAMATAPMLIASGSTFSMWAAYLGRMPVIWPQDQRRQALHGADWQYEIELGYEPLPEQVAGLLRRRFSERRHPYAIQETAC